jgi:hypothetical protein
METKMHRQCQECRALADETQGRMVILDQESATADGECEGFQWSFLCIQCVRDWRERGLKREGVSPKEVLERLERLEREYPIY